MTDIVIERNERGELTGISTRGAAWEPGLMAPGGLVRALVEGIEELEREADSLKSELHEAFDRARETARRADEYHAELEAERERSAALRAQVEQLGQTVDVFERQRDCYLDLLHRVAKDLGIGLPGAVVTDTIKAWLESDGRKVSTRDEAELVEVLTAVARTLGLTGGGIPIVPAIRAWLAGVEHGKAAR